MAELTRRTFLKMSGVAIGGIILTGCSSGGKTPGGYQFYRLTKTGDTVGSGSRTMEISEFGGSAHISSNGVVTFDAFDANQRHGLFQFSVDFSDTPRILQQDTVVVTDDLLNDLRKVRNFDAHDVDDQGNVAVVLQPKSSAQEGHFAGGLYYKQRNQDFIPLLLHGDKMDAGDTIFSGQFGDLALCENNGILVVGNHLPAVPGASAGQRLLHLPDPTDILLGCNKLIGAEDYLSTTDYLIHGLGIIDIGLNGSFSVSTHVSSEALLSASSIAGESATHHCLLSGHLTAPNEHFLLAAPDLLTATHSANVSYGPRVGADGVVASKVGGYAGLNSEALIFGEKVIRRTDKAGPSGEYAKSFTPGSVAADGSYYYTQYVETSDGYVSVELLMYDGNEHSTLLESGDQITNVDPLVTDIIFSTTTNHVDSDNRVVMLCHFTDNTTGLVVGIPV